jgi:hypothetical protein
MLRASGTAAVGGRVIDSQGQPVRETRVALNLYEEAEPHAHQDADHTGTFVLDISDLPVASAVLAVTKPYFDSITWVAGDDDLALLNQETSVRASDMVLQRRITPGFWIAIVVFARMVILIVTERLHTTAAALLAAAGEYYADTIVLGKPTEGSPYSL